MFLTGLFQRAESRHVSARRKTRPRSRRRLGCETLECRLALAVTAAADTYRLDVGAVLETERELVGLQTEWSYLEANTDPSGSDPDFESTWLRKDMPGATYNGPAFRTGLGLFGYGGIVFDDPPATGLNTPLDPQFGEKPHTAYFTRTFEFAGDPLTVGGLTAYVLADDGAFFYLNGQNIGRVNMGADEGTYGARASDLGNEEALVSVDLTNNLQTGLNYLAVSVHDVRFQTSGDLGFDTRLRYWRSGDSVLDNDTRDSGEPPGITAVEVQGQPIAPGAESVTVATGHGALTMRPNGTFRYAPAAGFAGSDSFTYRAGDGVGVSSSAVVTILVSTGSTGPTCEELDINSSGVVDRGDFAAMASAYGSFVGAGSDADFSGDGRIGIRDVIYVRDALGQNCGGAPQAVTRRALAVDRVHSQPPHNPLRTSVRRGLDRGMSAVAVTEHADSALVRDLRGRRAAWV
jgi:hypothetical protein